jgi:hypothetical protein
LTRIAALLVGLAASLIPIAAARADTPCPANAPHVLVVVGHVPPGFDVASMIERLAQELTPRGIVTCTRASALKPIAVVRLERGSAESDAASAIALDIEVRDAVTQKRIGRQLDLNGVPRDGQALLVALSADELLQASWAELDLEHAPRPAVALPAAARPAMAPARAPSRVSIGVEAAAETWSGGVALFGADAEVSVRLAPRLALLFAAGARVAPDVDGPDGAVITRAALLRVGPSLALTRADAPLALSWAAAARGYLVDYEGRAVAPATSTSHVQPALALETGPRLALAFDSIGASLVLDGAVAAALAGAGVDDAGRRLEGLAGVGATVALGFFVGHP